SVLIVKPGGTGRPRLVISARFAPLPPSRNFCSFEPSSNAKTYRIVFLPLGRDHKRARQSVVKPLAGAREEGEPDHSDGSNRPHTCGEDPQRKGTQVGERGPAEPYR